MSQSPDCERLLFRLSGLRVCRFAAIVAGMFVAGGCGSKPSSEKDASADKSADAAPGDVWTAAIKGAEPGEKKYLEAARPIVDAVAARDYDAFYQWLSSHALAKIREDQFYPVDTDTRREPIVVLTDVTKEKFLEWMKKMEEHLAPPHSVRHPFVTSIDPKELSGKGDAITTMYAIGGIPAEVPEAIRKAAIRVQINCDFDAETVKQIASDLGISEEQVRSGKWPENDKGYDPDERPYINMKFVLVEEEGYLRVGYFEFMGPSMLD